MSAPKIDHVEQIDADRVRHVALLGRLALSEEDVQRFSRDLTSVIHHINKLGQLDLKDVPPTSHPLPMSNVFRADERHASLSNEAALANAPEQEDHCFKVPQII